MKVGKRLAIGFGATLLLLLAVAIASWLSIRQTAADTDALLSHHLKTERLVSGWKAIVETNVQRAVAAAKTHDPATQKMFEDGIVANSRIAEAKQRALAELLDDPQAKALLDAALAQRTVYQDARKRALAAKAAGDMEQAERIIAQEFMPAGASYVARMEALVERQQAAIDEIGVAIHQRSTGSAWMIAILSAASVALALLLGWLISRSLLKQLGGEPARWWAAWSARWRRSALPRARLSTSSA